MLRQLFFFEEGDSFYRPAVTKFSNDLSATRYFNTVNVETILPPDERSALSTLAFDNAPAGADNDNDGIIDSDEHVVSSSKDNVGESSVNMANRQSDISTDDANNNNNDNINTNSDASVNKADIAPIEFEVDEETSAKLQAIKQKAERLNRLPSNRVLDEKEEKSENILGKISDSISNVAEKIFPKKKVYSLMRILCHQRLRVVKP